MNLSYNFWTSTSGGLKLFNRFDWNTFLKKTVKSIESKYDIEIDIIIPWGFEIFNNIMFLKRNIRRYYCYFGLKSGYHPNKQNLAQEITMEIYNQLKIVSPHFYNKITLLILEEVPVLLRELNYSCAEGDCLLSISLRDSNNILLDYSKYIIGTVDLMLNGYGEVQDYKEKLLSRWRFFQLYLIQEELFGHLCPSSQFNLQQLKLDILKLAHNHIWPFYNLEKSYVKVSDHELFLIDEFIIPRIKQIKAAMTKGYGEIVREKIKGFHSDDILNIEISADIYKIALEKLQLTYKNFAQEIG